MVDLVTIAKEYSKKFDEANLKKFQNDSVISGTIEELDKKVREGDNTSENVLNLFDRIDYLETFKGIENPFVFSKTLHYVWGNGWSNRVGLWGHNLDTALKRLPKEYSPEMIDTLLECYLKNKGNVPDFDHSDIFADSLTFLPHAIKLGYTVHTYTKRLQLAIEGGRLRESLKELSEEYNLRFADKSPLIPFYNKAEEYGIRDKANELLSGVEHGFAWKRLEAYGILHSKHGFGYEQLKGFLLAAGKEEEPFFSLVNPISDHYTAEMDPNFVFEKAIGYLVNPKKFREEQLDEDGNPFSYWIQSYKILLQRTNKDFAEPIMKVAKHLKEKEIREYLFRIYDSSSRDNFIKFVKEQTNASLEEYQQKLAEEEARIQQTIIECPNYKSPFKPEDYVPEPIAVNFYWKEAFVVITHLIEKGYTLGVDHFKKIFDVSPPNVKEHSGSFSQDSTLKALTLYLGLPEKA